MQSTEHTLETYANEIKTRGYTIIEKVLSEQQIEAAGRELDEIFLRESKQARKQGWHNSRSMVAFMLLQKHALFRSICLGPIVVPLMKMLLGDDCVISSLNGLSMTPGGEPQELHRDSLGVPGHVLTINVLHTLDDFTRENGCTRVVPFSHDFDEQALGSLVKGHFQSLEEKAVYLEVPAGSVIAYNGAILHAGSTNATNKPRRALHPFFTRSWIKPQWDIPASLSPKVIKELSAQQKELFGFPCSSSLYNYRTNEVVWNQADQGKPEGFRQRVRHIKNWLLEQTAGSRRETNGD